MPRDPFAVLQERGHRPKDEVFEALSSSLDFGQRTRGEQPGRRPKLMSRNRRLIWSSLCLFVGLVLTSVSSLLHSAAQLVTVGIAASVAVGMILLAGIAPGRADRLHSGWRRALMASLIVAVVAGLGLYASHFLPAQEFFGGGHGEGAATCAGHALMTGLVCSAGLLYLWRNTDPFTPGMTGALLGGFGGVLGILGLGVGCPNLEGWHLIVGHGSSLLVLASLGWLAGRKWLTP